MHAKSLQLCLALCDLMDCNLPGSSAYGIPQARILEWVAISFPRASSQPRDQTCLSPLQPCYQHHSPNGTFFFFFFTKERCSLSQSPRVNGLHYVSFLVVGILCITDTIHYSFLQNIFTSPPNLLCSPTLLLTTTNLFIVCIVLPFPECHIVGIIP